MDDGRTDDLSDGVGDDRAVAGGADNERLAQWVEEFGLALESRALPRTAGRIFARLLVCEPPEQTAAQLSTALKISRGTVSDMTRLLLQGGLIQRESRSGERETFFRVGPGNSTLFLRGAIEPLRMRRRLAERGLVMLRDRPPEVRERLEELRDVYLMSEESYLDILDRWEHMRVARQAEDAGDGGGPGRTGGQS